jgi:cold shock CspA family protein
MRGKIKEIVTDRGIGHIKGEDGRDFFFHRSALQGLDFKQLHPDEQVEFEIEEFRGPTTPKAIRAMNVRAVK